MVEIFGRIEQSVVENGERKTVFRIPAFSKAIAKRRANMNARLKSLENFESSEPVRVGSGDIPSQSIYDVTVTSDR